MLLEDSLFSNIVLGAMWSCACIFLILCRDGLNYTIDYVVFILSVPRSKSQIVILQCGKDRRKGGKSKEWKTQSSFRVFWVNRKCSRKAWVICNPRGVGSNPGFPSYQLSDLVQALNVSKPQKKLVKLTFPVLKRPERGK